jgi:glycosyltransferase involved in cell wall biosynthesis
VGDYPSEFIFLTPYFGIRARDGSLKLIEMMSDVKCISHPVNMGKGAAIRTGLKHITGDVVVIQDGDLEYNPEVFPLLMQPIIEGEVDVVYGSRFLGKTEGMRFLNFVANKILTIITNILYGARITDMETCYKMIRVSCLQGIPLRANRFDFEPEITAKILKKGVRYMELPITYSGRTHDEGKKIGWKDGVQALWSIIRYRFSD